MKLEQSTEYWVLCIDKHGDANDGDAFDTLAEARREFDAREPTDEFVAYVLEKRRDWWDPVQQDLKDRHFQGLAIKGDAAALESGGFRTHSQLQGSR
jgi:hypothetical protein